MTDAKPTVIESALACGAAGAGKLIGPGRFKSGAGLITYLEAKLLSLSFQDEFGGFLGRISDPNRYRPREC
jgi:hypothetical protein